ncbi:MAG: metal ABC transporter ATP-binding protein [Thermomicrobiales bacterium]
MSAPTNPDPPAIAVRNATVVYPNGNVALHDASLELRAGSLCGLIGVNGGGKSTLFKVLMGTVPMASGTVSIRGRSPRQAQRLNQVVYMPQSEDIDWNFPVSVADVVMMGRYGYMGIRRIPSAKDRRVVDEAIERLQMTPFRDRQIGELSGGQRKRAFLARALAQQGSVMLLDEPLAGVDTTTQTAIVDLLKDLRAEEHTVLISTHDLGSVADFCDQVALINGTVVAAGPTHTTFTVANLTRTFGGALPVIQAGQRDPDAPVLIMEAS